MRVILGILIIGLLLAGCVKEEASAAPEIPVEEPEVEAPQEESGFYPPPEPANGILINELPSDADIIFDSVRHALSDPDCLDGPGLKENFINDPACNRVIYDNGRLALHKQLFAMDIESGEATQITNLDCYFVTGQAMDSKTLMVNAICSDTDGDGEVGETDRPDLYILHLDSGEMDCLTCDMDLVGINNPDYSSVNEKILFSAGTGYGINNRLFTIDIEKDLVQITDDSEYLDFDCSWSEDATKMVFSRLPEQDFPLTIPSQIWIADADGSNMKKITDGGDNPGNEGQSRGYPIGVDADPDFSPDNKEIVISRLATGQRNGPFGVWELVVIDVDSGKETVLDSNYANMIPEWKEYGILFIRQEAAGANAMEIKQVLYLYKDGEFEALEEFPYDVFPIGAYGAHWIS